MDFILSMEQNMFTFLPLKPQNGVRTKAFESTEDMV